MEFEGRRHESAAIPRSMPRSAARGGGAGLQTAAEPRHPDELAREKFLAREGRPLFLCDWRSALFIHYSIDPRELQPHVPYELDLHAGQAWLSLVAFTIDRLRLRAGGRLGEMALRPIARHHFLNVRSYVRCGAERGIYFVTEWLSNELSVLLGPRTFGLPYQAAHITYCNDGGSGVVAGDVAARGASFKYGATLTHESPRPAAVSSRDEFLLERYIAFTRRGKNFKFFRVWHEPWPQRRADVRVSDMNLVLRACPWFARAQYAGANFSTGVHDIWIGWPRLVGRDL